MGKPIILYQPNNWKGGYSMRKCSSMTFTLLLLVSSAVVAMAQGNATLTGTITDQTGAVVAGANVTATNIATNVGSTTQTTDSGLYRFPTLPVGAYRVVVAAT